MLVALCFSSSTISKCAGPLDYSAGCGTPFSSTIACCPRAPLFSKSKVRGASLIEKSESETFGLSVILLTIEVDVRVTTLPLKSIFRHFEIAPLSLTA